MLALGVAIMLVAAIMVSGCSASGSSGGATEKKAEPIRIGAVLSLTGTYAGLGVPEKRAIDLEVAKINDEGGVNGRPIEVIIEDDATDPATAQSVTVKLIDQEGVVAVLGATGTGGTMGMRADIERAQIPQVSMAGGSVITDQLSPWVFQTPWPNRIVVPFVLNYLKSKGVTKLAMISDSGGYGKDGKAVTEKDFAAAGMTLVANEVFNLGDKDMTAQLTKIKGAGADALLVWAAGSEGSTILKNAKDLDLTASLTSGLIVGTPGAARKELIESSGDAANGFEFAAGRILLPESYGTATQAYKVATDFIDRYKAEYGTEPDIFAGHAYDALHITVEALKRLPADADIDPVALRDEIEATNGFVGIGGTFTYTPEDHNGLTEKDLVMYRIENGAWTLAEGAK